MSKKDAKPSEKLNKSLIAPPKLKAPSLSTSIPNPAKVGQTGIRTPKQKQLPGAFDKPSLFFKSEGALHPNIENLRAFLESTRAKKQSI